MNTQEMDSGMLFDAMAMGELKSLARGLVSLLERATEEVQTAVETLKDMDRTVAGREAILREAADVADLDPEVVAQSVIREVREAAPEGVELSDSVLAEQETKIRQYLETPG